MNTWFTSDTHFGHTNIIQYCQRLFSNVYEMDESLIANWNHRVKPKDTVYHLGDFALTADPNYYIDRLNGKIILIRGNHDHHKNMKNAHFAEIHDMLTIKALGSTITLCHYAMRCWPQSHYGSFHLFGHNHGKMRPRGRSFDVGVDCNNYRPVSLDEVKTIMLDLEDE